MSVKSVSVRTVLPCHVSAIAVTDCSVVVTTKRSFVLCVGGGGCTSYGEFKEVFPIERDITVK